MNVHRERRVRPTPASVNVTMACIALAFAASCGPERHGARGAIVEIDADGLGVTIDHDPIPGLMPAMRMHFDARDAAVLEAAVPGTEVRFTLERRGERLRITSLDVLGGPPTPRPGIHDHRPHHGGVVTMIGLRHLEATATPAGALRVYVTDVWRRPIPLEGWTGKVTLRRGAGTTTIDVLPTADSLGATGPPLAGDSVLVELRIRPPDDAEPLVANLILPLAPGLPGAAIAPRVQCDPASLRSRPGALCLLEFGEPVTALAPIGDTPDVLLGIANAGPSAWSLDDGRLLHAFVTPPAVEGSPTSLPHAEIVDAMAVAPDGAEAIVATEGRLLRYDTRSGRLLRILPSPAALLRSLEWSPDDASLLAIPNRGTGGWRIAATDGASDATPSVPSPITAGTVAEDSTAVLGTEAGGVYVVRGDARALLASVPRPVRALAIAGARLVVATGAGTVETRDMATGTVVAATEATSPCHRIAVSPDARLVACAAFDQAVHVSEIATGRAVVTFPGNGALVQALAFVAGDLVTADANGAVVRWQISEPRAGGDAR